MSLLIALEAASIFLLSAELPMIEAAFLNSRQVSSRRTIVLTISPSGTSVNSQISAKGVPCKIDNSGQMSRPNLYIDYNREYLFLTRTLAHS